MSATKLLNLLALSTLAVLLCSQGAMPANALSADHNVAARNALGGHGQMIRKRRNDTHSKRQCRQRDNAKDGNVKLASSSSEAPAQTSSTDAPSSTDWTPTSTSDASQSTSSDNNGGDSSSNSGSGSSSGSSGSNNGGSTVSAPGGGKVGFCWGGSPDIVISHATYSFYNWSASIPSNVRDLGLSPMVQLWGYKNVDEFEQNVKQGYADWILGMNEPNEVGQSNMSPEEAVKLWQEHIQPKKDLGYKLVSPATSGNPAGKEWMQKFYDQCQGCTFDAQAVHWYDIDAQNFIDYVNDYHDRFGYPVFVTEFADQNFNGGAQASMDDIWAFKAAVTPFLENTDWVLGYFPFGFMHDMVNVNYDNQLMGSDGKPTALGASYIN
ncbi:fungal hydrophobin [Schizophyllum commune Loenen D]|nr:fungal hydrophobin [Schizophyllum commune Loenen D]